MKFDWAICGVRPSRLSGICSWHLHFFWMSVFKIIIDINEIYGGLNIKFGILFCGSYQHYKNFLIVHL